MAWISLFLLINSFAAELPRLMTKHTSDTLRFISFDGKYAYVQKKAGVLGLVSNFKSLDFLTEPNNNDFLIKSSPFQKRLIIESIPSSHNEINLFKKHQIYIVDYGNTQTRLIGEGQNAKLHQNDEWLSFYDPKQKTINLQNLLTQKKIQIKISQRLNPFFKPQVEMLSPESLIYTDINETGHSALIFHNHINSKSQIIFKSNQSATKIEICLINNNLIMGEFPFEGVLRSSQIQITSLKPQTTPSGFTSIYSSFAQDLGNIVCSPNGLYFVKTTSFDSSINFKTTEAAKIDINTKSIEIKTDLKNVGQIIDMDGRILIPSRGELLVIEGDSNLKEDVLKKSPTSEELQIDL